MTFLGYSALVIGCLVSVHLCDETSTVPSFFNIFRPQITVSKLPPILEIILQRIQTQYSNYIYEDLSRPPTYDRPTYAPYVPTTSSTTPKIVDLVDLEDEIIEESFVIPTDKPAQLIFVDTYDLVNSGGLNSTIDVTYQFRRLNVPNVKKSLQEQTLQILREHNLENNSTRFFIKDKCFTTCYKKYKEISSLFSNADGTLQKEQIENLKAISDNIVVLTSIGKRIYMNSIKIK